MTSSFFFGRERTAASHSLLSVAIAMALLIACGDDEGATPDMTTGRDLGARDGAVDMEEGNDAADRDADSAPDTGVDMNVDMSVTVDLGPPEECGQQPPPEVTVENIAGDGGFDQPLFVTSLPDDASTLFLLEKPGRIILVIDGEIQREPFLDFTGSTGAGENLLTNGEQGLLGLALHPDYATNGRFFVYFTPGEPRRNVVAEYRRSAGNPLRADRTEVARLVEINDSEGNHNGGMLAFGPDGMLYVGMGDEGGGGDQHGRIGNALNTSNLFGSVLRLDVDNAPSYASGGSPFIDGALPQIWAYGLRNPWRFSFDSLTGDLWIGDVGQNEEEEIDFLPAGHPGGANFGWRAYEGNRVFDADLTAMVDASGYVPPVVGVPRNGDDLVVRGARSITGGVVYRGNAIPGLRGFYIYSDYTSQDTAALQLCDGEVRQHQRIEGLGMTGGGIASFGEDADGEIYIANLNRGRVYRVVAP